MARQQRNDVDYFPHPVNHGKKMFYIRQKFGNDGYVIWMMLLENLGKADNHYLYLNDEIQLMYLSSEMMVDSNKLLEVIEVLVKFDEFDSELWESKILFNQKFNESISDAYKKRSNDIITRNQLLDLLSAKGILNESKLPRKRSKLPSKGSENTQSKVKESKVKNSKEENNIPPLDEFIQHALSKNSNLDTNSIQLKYEAWIENGWKDGNNKKIVNWKSKLTNTVQYLKEKTNDNPYRKYGM